MSNISCNNSRVSTDNKPSSAHSQNGLAALRRVHTDCACHHWTRYLWWECTQDRGSIRFIENIMICRGLMKYAREIVPNGNSLSDEW